MTPSEGGNPLIYVDPQWRGGLLNCASPNSDILHHIPRIIPEATGIVH